MRCGRRRPGRRRRPDVRNAAHGLGPSLHRPALSRSPASSAAPAPFAARRWVAACARGAAVAPECAAQRPAFAAAGFMFEFLLVRRRFRLGPHDGVFVDAGLGIGRHHRQNICQRADADDQSKSHHRQVITPRVAGHRPQWANAYFLESHPTQYNTTFTCIAMTIRLQVNAAKV
jgi:hypothetical protein